MSVPRCFARARPVRLDPAVLASMKRREVDMGIIGLLVAIILIILLLRLI